MIARQAFRRVPPCALCTRHFATDGTPNKSSNALFVTAAVAGVAAGGYFFYSSSQRIASAKAAEPKASRYSAFKGGDQGFIDLKLESSELINHNTKKLRFALPNSEDVSGLNVASALITKYQGPGTEKPVTRPYTPIKDDVGFFELLVKKYPNGPMSTHIHDLQPGQRLSFKGPISKYPLSENQHSHIALIAGGTGITPMWQLADAIFSNPSDKTRVTLVFGNISEEDVLLKKEFEELENTYPSRFRAFYVLDNPPESWQGARGRITKELLKTVLPEPKELGIKIFVCGPPGMYKAISGTKKSPQDQGELDGTLKDLGYSKDQVFKF